MVTTRSVPFFSGARGLRAARPRLERRLREVAGRGVFTSGPAVAELERALASVTGAENVIAVANGTDGLILMLRAAGVGPGDEVIVPAYTFFATASAVVHAGAEPVIVDIEPGSYAMDPERAAAAVTPRTKAIMPVHLFSQTADVARLRELADAHGIDMLEDSAEAIGMRRKGVHAGLFGRAGVLSFFPTKTLCALGDAGAVLTDDAELAERVRRMRCHGQATDGAYIYEELGYNSRCDEVQAAVLLTRLETLDDDIGRRNELAALYTQQLAGVVTVPAPADEGAPVFYVYLIETDRRDELVRFLAEHGVETEVYYPRPLSLQPALSRRPGARHPIPVAAATSRRAVALPLYPDLAEEEVLYVCALIHRFFGRTA
jgi:UDP-2-acetamido-2-deoxy-ribo-hexuluronate aminotransferase